VRVRFGEFVLDDQARELRREGEPVHLSPKAFQLLELLLRRRPEAVSKAALQERVWPGVHVTEASLAGVVAELRAVLNDPKRTPRFIRTVHGFGYSFCGEAVETARGMVRDAPSGPAYRLVGQRREIQLTEGENLLGRDRDSVAWLDSPTVSRRHARIVITGDHVTLEDLGSRNGTFLCGRRIEAPSGLHDGDEVRLGSVAMTFRVFEPAETETAPE
jgi:DNA-binding winged helix-turn-helix (wHTH) protein